MLINNLDKDQSTPDVWTYKWGPLFTSKNAYKELTDSGPASPLFRWLWKSCCRSRLKFFFWLLLKDRLNTRNIMRRKNMVLHDYSCVLCSGQVEDTLMHIFFLCPFSQVCWDFVDIHWNFNIDPITLVIQAQQDFGLRCLREVMISTCWSIWCHRNSIIFYSASTSLVRWKAHFRVEICKTLSKQSLP